MKDAPQTQPQRIGKFEIIEELGRGGMSTVYLARDSLLDRLVAVKLIRLPDDAGPVLHVQFIDRFIREARAIAGLDHPNVVKFHEIGEQDGMHYIAMEYINGGTLGRLISDREPRDLRERLDLMLQILDGVAAIHEAGLAHRDLKPRNIMLTSKGQIKIMDFGAVLHEEGDRADDQVLGTPRYMSPEQLQKQPGDFRSDIFSLGSICYELMTFAKAFPGDSFTEVSQMIRKEAPVPPSQIDMLLPSSLDAIIGKAMAKPPAERYQSCREMASGLKRLVAPFMETDNGEAGFRELSFAPGEIIFSQGDPGDAAYLLKKGKVRILKHTENREREISVFTPIALFGEMAILLPQGCRTASAVALEPSMVTEITRENFEALVKQSPRSIQAVLKVLATRLADLTARWVALCDVREES